MTSIETKITLDNLKATAIAVRIDPLSEDLQVSDVFPHLYDHGIALVVDPKGYIIRCITNVTLDHDTLAFEESTLQCASQHTLVKDIRAIFDTYRQKLVPLLDDKGRYTGFCASRNELMKVWAGQIEMPRIGGLSTPVGVYLTTGIHTAGAGAYGLTLTGISFAIFVLLARWGFVYLSLYFEAIRDLNVIFQMAIVFGLLLLIIRFSPMAGLHAAEHQTIHAIEKGLPLTPDNVSSQPKAHHRCGTNIMVGLVGLEMAVIGASSIEPPEAAVVFLVCWMVFLVISWQHLGLVIQNIFTTKRANRRQLENAIMAGRDLVERYRKRPHKNPNMWQRVWGSGMIQILFSFIFTYWLFEQVITYLLNR